MAINAPPETTPRMPPPSTTSPSFVLSPQSSRPSLRRPRRRSTSLTTGWSGPGCVLEVLGVFEEAIMLEAPLDAPLSCWWLVLPELLEPAGGQFCIAHSMADVPMAQVLLDRTGVVPFVGQLESARVPQHMRVNRERKAGGFADACDKLWPWAVSVRVWQITSRRRAPGAGPAPLEALVLAILFPDGVSAATVSGRSTLP